MNNIIIVVELGKYKDFLANQKYLTNYKKFFYYSYNLSQKRYYSLDNTGEDLTSTIGPRAQELVRLHTKSKEPSLLLSFVFSSRQEEE